jgi:hypothetical protein
MTDGPPPRLSEIFPVPAKGQEEWVEIWNAESEEIDLDGWRIDDAEGGSKPFALSGSLLPGQRLVLNKIFTHISFNNDGDSMRILRPDATVAEIIEFPKLPTSAALAVSPEDPDTWCVTTKPTPGEGNICKEPVAKQKKTAAKKTTTKKKAAAKVTRKTTVKPIYENVYEGETGSGVLEELSDNPILGSVIHDDGGSAGRTSFPVADIALAVVTASGGSGFFGWSMGRRAIGLG